MRAQQQPDYPQTRLGSHGGQHVGETHELFGFRLPHGRLFSMLDSVFLL
jgi:hypothetical protein